MTWKCLSVFACVASLANAPAQATISQVTTTLTGSVSLTVQSIQALTVTAPSTVTLVVNDANPGSIPTAVSNSTSTYAISTNATASLSASGANIPAGVNFNVQMGASTGLAATGSIVLKTAAGAGGTVTLYSTVNSGFYNGTVTYTVSAPVTTNPLANTAFQLPYTLQ